MIFRIAAAFIFVLSHSNIAVADVRGLLRGKTILCDEQIGEEIRFLSNGRVRYLNSIDDEALSSHVDWSANHVDVYWNSMGNTTVPARRFRIVNDTIRQYLLRNMSFISTCSIA